MLTYCEECVVSPVAAVVRQIAVGSECSAVQLHLSLTLEHDAALQR